MGTLWNTLFYAPIMNGLLLLYSLLGENLGLAIIMLTLVLRVALFPLMRSQYESTKKLKSLQPMMEKLKKKYSRNPQKLQEEQLALYRKVGYNPLGCFVSTLLPFPFLIAIYQAIRAFSGGETLTGVYPFVSNLLGHGREIIIKTMFLGIDLSKAYRPIASKSGYLSLVALPYLFVIVLVGLSQYFSTKYQQKLMGVDGSTEKKKKESQDKKKDPKKDDPQDPNTMMTEMNKSMQFTFPIMISIIALDLPAALSLYWILQSWIPVGINVVYDKFIKNRKK